MENKKGVYRGGKVYSNHPKTEVYEVANRLDLWASGNQEVEFEVKNGQAIIKLLGKILPNEEVDVIVKSVI